MRIALAATNPIVGDVTGNVERIRALCGQARAAQVDLIAFPEQAILGYPAKDLLLRPDVIQANLDALDAVAQASDGLGVVVGYAEINDEAPGRQLWNSAALFEDGRPGRAVAQATAADLRRL